MSRQTLRYLKQRFSEVGIHPKSRHGQNFLIDLNLLELLADAAQVDARDVVLEVGTGTGSLTALIAKQAAEVVTVEVDPQMYQLASEELVDFDNITLINRDALAGKATLAPELIDLLKEKLAVDPQRRLKLVANLPYNVATPILSNLLSTRVLPVSMTATIQKELAERIVAPPSTKDYSALSIWMQSQCRGEIVRLMPPSVFWPRPKVHSAILHLVVEPERRAQIPDLDFFHDCIRTIFLYRRKYLRSALVSAYGKQLDKTDVDTLMQELGFDANTRAEELDIPTMLRLTTALKQRLHTP